MFSFNTCSTSIRGTKDEREKAQRAFVKELTKLKQLFSIFCG